MSTRPIVVFDMDGVLVDVTESYRETIRQTVLHFTGFEITRETIQDYKNAGGWNNDWALSQKIIADVGGLDVPYETVVGEFQRLFLGDNNDGLILRERWVPDDGLLTRLSQRYSLGIFTGRPREEARLTIARFAPVIEWSAVVADEDVENSKPAPDGLNNIKSMSPGTPLWYIGDTVDDARASAAAGTTFVGIAHRLNPRHAELAELLRLEGAVAVLDNVNELEQVL